MKIKCNIEAIRKGIHIVGSVISGSGIKPVLQNVRISTKDNTLELSTTDLEVSANYVIDPVEVIEQGVIVCPEVKIASILREWTSDYIEIAEENKICLITGKDSYFKILCANPEEFPAIPKFVDENYIEMDSNILSDMIRKTAFIITGERIKYGSNGVFLEVSRNKVKMVTNDGRRLAEVKRKVKNPKDLTSNCIIPIKGVLQMLRVISEEDDVVKVKIEEKRVFVNTKSSTLCSQLIEGQYPKYEEVIPVNLDKKINLSKDAFFHAVRRGAIMTTDEYKLLRFKFSNNTLEMKCTSPDIGESKVEIPIEYMGNELEVGFNPDFILDLSKVIDTDDVEIELKDSSTAGLFKVGSDYKYIVMPTNLMGE